MFKVWHWYLGQYQKAIEFCEQGLTIARELGDRQIDRLRTFMMSLVRLIGRNAVIVGEPAPTEIY